MANDPEEVVGALQQRSSSQLIRPKHDPLGVRGMPAFDTVTISDRVNEEHVYLFHSVEGRDEVWEADLIGDMSPDRGHGKLPPLIHAECPFCTSPNDRRAMTIDKLNKGYEIEPVTPFIKTVVGMNGPIHVEVSRLLHVRESITCPYCQTRFTIRGSTIQRA